VTFSAPYHIPDTAPAEVLAELDAAAQALDALTARAAQLTLAMEEQSRSVRIELVRGGTRRRLSPTQLFELLG
jgi:hypothetical protein